jgi:CHAT domain-containing protein/Flp pilus assembly protein TadD
MSTKWLGRAVPLLVIATIAGLWGSPLEPLTALAQSKSALRALENRVSALEDAGKFGEAIPLAEQLLAGTEAQFGKTHTRTADALKWLAELYREQGRYSEAEPLYKKSLAIYEMTRGASHSDVADVLNSLGVLYVTQGRYLDAEVLYKRSLAIYDNAPGAGNQKIGMTLNNLALLYTTQGRYEDAEHLFKRSLTIWEKIGVRPLNVAWNLNNLAEVYRRQERFTEAEPLYKRALSILEKRLPAGHPDIAQDLQNLAVLYAQQGRYSDAEPLFKRSLTIFEMSLGASHPYVAGVLNNLGTVYVAQGRYVDTEKVLRKSLAIIEEALGPNNLALTMKLRTLAVALLNQQRLAEAYDALRRSGQILSASLAREQQVERSESEPVRLGIVSVAWSLAADDAKRRQETLQASFEDAQQVSQQVSAAALTQMAVRFGAATGAIAQRIREQQDLLSTRKQLDQALIAAISEPVNRRNGAKVAELRRDLEMTDAKLKMLASEIEREFPAYAELASPKPLTIAGVQGLLAPDEALVAFMTGLDDETFVWAVAREGVTWQRIPIGLKALQEKVTALRVGLDVDDLEKVASEGKLFDLGRAYELYTTLLGPVADTIKGKHHLIVVPSGPLTSLPFHLLVSTMPPRAMPNKQQLDDYRQARWVIRDHAVTILPSVSSLRALRALAKAAQGSKPLVGFGDPEFGGPAPGPPRVAAIATSPVARGRTRSYSKFWSGNTVDLDALRSGLAPLPETGEELRAVAKAVGANPGDIYLGRAASETMVKQMDLTPFRIVYFATHGLVSGEIKGLGEPALALTIPATASDVDDGLLTASEVSQLKLDADWVVLSACNTAAGDTVGAESLSGLARAFFYAGTRALLVSHWRVDSVAAARLTTATFAELQKAPTIGRAEAVRRAMLAFLNDRSNPWNAYPDYWAPFSVVGEGGK